MRISEEEYRALVAGRHPKPKQERPPSKYRNRKKEIDGIQFDSTKEANRYIDLKAWQYSGQISRLERQREFEIIVNGQLICRYVADFCYEIDGRQIVEDVKSKVTRKLPVYSIKKKLMAAVLGIEITEF